jgi:hypothetical protein
MLGRRKTLIAGAVAVGIGNSLLLVADGFWGLAMFELALGVGHSLISGADIALLYDTELALGRGEQAQRQVVGRLYGFRTVSESIAALLCSLLLLHSMQTVVIVQAISGWVPLILALLLVEPPGARLASDDHLGNMLEICRVLLTRSRVLRLVVLALCVWSLTTFYAVWLLQKIWESQGIDLVHFGWLWAGLTVIAALAGRYAHKAEDLLGTTGLFLFIGLSPVVGYLGLEHLGVVGGYLASTTFFLSRGFGLVVLRDALNRRVPGEYRATANSLTSFGFRGAFMLTGPLVGYYLDLWGMQTTLYLLAGATGVIFAVLVLPLLLAVRGLPTNAELERRALAEANRPCRVEEAV